MSGSELTPENLSVTDEGLSCEVSIPASSALFRGHFPDRPVLPAISVVDLIWRMAEEMESARLRLQRIRYARFRLPILPGDTIQIELKRTGALNPVHFRVSRGSEQMANGSIDFQAEGA